MLEIPTRRSFLFGLAAFPAIIAIDRLMPVKALWTPAPDTWEWLSKNRLLLTPDGVWRLITRSGVSDGFTWDGTTIDFQTGPWTIDTRIRSLPAAGETPESVELDYIHFVRPAA